MMVEGEGNNIGTEVELAHLGVCFGIWGVASAMSNYAVTMKAHNSSEGVWRNRHLWMLFITSPRSVESQNTTMSNNRHPTLRRRLVRSNFRIGHHAAPAAYTRSGSCVVDAIMFRIP